MPDNKRTYEKLLPPIDWMVNALWYKISDDTKKDLVIALRMMWYLDHQYDKRDSLEQTVYYEKIISKLGNSESANIWEMDETANELCKILEDRGIIDDFTFYIKKVFLHNDIACHTKDNLTFIKHKYFEWYISAKIITTFLKKEWLPYDSDKFLSNLVGISNLLDDFLDLEDDYKNWVSEINPSIKLKTLLLLNVFRHTIDKFLCSWKINKSMIKHVFYCTKNHIKKTIKDKKNN